MTNLPAIQSSASPCFKNRVINGDIRVDQRNSGASQTITAAAALAYTVDRFYAYCAGANVTGQQVAISSGQNRYRFTGLASNTAVGLCQRIEAQNSLDLAGQTATLQVKLSSTSLTSITWTAYYATTANAFGTLASPTKIQIATGAFTISSTEATYSAQIAIPSAAVTGIEIVFQAGALLASQTLTIGDVQLEAGTVATAFEKLPYGQQLALCQRYYEPLHYTNDAARPYAFFGCLNSTNDNWGNWYFKQTKFSSPTFAVVSGAWGTAPSYIMTNPESVLTRTTGTLGGAYLSGTAGNVACSATSEL